MSSKSYNRGGVIRGQRTFPRPHRYSLLGADGYRYAFELPTAELNQQLSALRVTLVRHELEKRGVPTKQLLPVPLGDTRPIAPKSDPDAALENRRITFRVLD